MADRWVTKIEATTCFKVTERTLDNWVKAGKISKARKNGQIMYEIKDALEEKSNEDSFDSLHHANFSSKNDDNHSSNDSNEDNPGSADQVLVLEVRLEEKMNQIHSLMETLDRWEKDKNSLILERGKLAEKSNLLTMETETLRKEKEMLLNDCRVISERSFSKFGVFIFVSTVMVLLFGIGYVLFWKFSEKEIDLRSQATSLEDAIAKKETIHKSSLELADKVLQDAKAELNAKNNKLLDELLKAKEEWQMANEKLTEEKLKVSEESLKHSEAIRRVSEQEERVSEIRKNAETLQKTIERLQIENNQVNLQLKVLEATHEVKGKDSSKEKEKDAAVRFLKNAEE